MKTWIAIENDTHDILAASHDFETAQKIGRAHCEENGTTFCMREYAEVDEDKTSVSELLRRIADILEKNDK